MARMKTALVCGAGGFIGSHIVRRLRKEGYWVKGIDLKLPEFSKTEAHNFVVGDLRDPKIVEENIMPFDEVYQLAADMGGAGYLFTGENDANVMHNSALINLNILNYSCRVGVQKIFYSSSACVYPVQIQTDTKNPKLSENSVYPAFPDSEYGWEKLFGERLFLTFSKNHDIQVKIARFHNIFGTEGTWDGGKEKAPAAICRKVAKAKEGTNIDIWGDGKQTRSFLYIDECLEGVRRLVESNFSGPVNIGSEEMVSINKMAEMVIKISGKNLTLKHVKGPQGVRGRTSDNTLVKEKLDWSPSQLLVTGLEKTYNWILSQVNQDF